MVETFKNEEFGIEAVITDEIAKWVKHPYRVILRDVDADADATVSVIFGSYEQVLKAAKDFTK